MKKRYNLKEFTELDFLEKVKEYITNDKERDFYYTDQVEQMMFFESLDNLNHKDYIGDVTRIEYVLKKLGKEKAKREIIFFEKMSEGGIVTDFEDLQQFATSLWYMLVYNWLYEEEIFKEIEQKNSKGFEYLDKNLLIDFINKKIEKGVENDVF